MYGNGVHDVQCSESFKNGRLSVRTGSGHKRMRYVCGKGFCRTGDFQKSVPVPRPVRSVLLVTPFPLQTPADRASFRIVHCLSTITSA